MRGASERELVALLERTFGGRRSQRTVSVGIGDDAAVLQVPAGRLIWTVDTAVENVHFRTEWLSLEDIGWKSFHAAVSDVAAMGAVPVAALSNLVIPTSMGKKTVHAIAKGQAQAARALQCPVVGGNLSRGNELSVTTTVLGRVDEPLLRSGARPGDELWLIGELGMARAGLLWLSSHGSPSAAKARARTRAVTRCLEAWRRPRALVREALVLRGRAHAAIDVSDGLSADATHLSERSRVRVVIEEHTLRAALSGDLAAVGAVLGEDALELAMIGGEDYALLAAGPPKSRPRGVKRIGSVEKGRGVFLESGGARRRVRTAGFEHFR